MNSKQIIHLSSAVLLSAVLSACSSIDALDDVVQDNSQQYKKAQVMPALEIPPDLSGEQINDDITGNQSTESYSEQVAETPLTEKYNVEPSNKPVLTGDDDQRHLVVSGNPDTTWALILDFWKQKGIEVRRQEQRIGMMDTEGDEDDYAFRARMEPGSEPESVEIYISGVSFDKNQRKDEETLRQLAEFIGGAGIEQKQQQVAKAADSKQRSTPVEPQYAEPVEQKSAGINAVLIDEARGQQALIVEQTFADSWRSVGQILNHKGISVEDLERTSGIYYIHYIDPFNAESHDKSVLSSMAFWQSDEEREPENYYFIKLIEDAADTKIVVLDVDQVRTSSATARRLLAFIQEELTK